MDDEQPNARPLRFRTLGVEGLAPFEAGQLITADDLNEIVAALKDIDLRLRELRLRCP